VGPWRDRPPAPIRPNPPRAHHLALGPPVKGKPLQSPDDREQGGERGHSSFPTEKRNVPFFITDPSTPAAVPASTGRPPRRGPFPPAAVLTTESSPGNATDRGEGVCHAFAAPVRADQAPVAVRGRESMSAPDVMLSRPMESGRIGLVREGRESMAHPSSPRLPVSLPGLDAVDQLAQLVHLDGKVLTGGSVPFALHGCGRAEPGSGGRGQNRQRRSVQAVDQASRQPIFLPCRAVRER
jgi:hypothetical protein